jgi:hypothetical protein
MCDSGSYRSLAYPFNRSRAVRRLGRASQLVRVPRRTLGVGDWPVGPSGLGARL